GARIRRSGPPARTARSRAPAATDRLARPRSAERPRRARQQGAAIGRRAAAARGSNRRRVSCIGGLATLAIAPLGRPLINLLHLPAHFPMNPPMALAPPPPAPNSHPRR